MKISAKYKQALETYMEWENVQTPASGTFQESQRPSVFIGTSGEEIKKSTHSAAEVMCAWESSGTRLYVMDSEYEKSLLLRYTKGKSQKDYWTKEIGWWNRKDGAGEAYIAEEFLAMLGPIPFIDLFGRGPIPWLVRYYHDNNYALWEFKLDGFMTQKVQEWGMSSYFDRDYRGSSLQNAWRVLRIKWIDPLIWRTKRRCAGREY